MISDETVSFKVEKDKNIKAREILKQKLEKEEI